MTDLVECLRKQGQHAAADEIERLRARILELEATIATIRGTVRAFRDEYECADFSIEHDQPPTTPR